MFAIAVSATIGCLSVLVLTAVFSGGRLPPPGPLGQGIGLLVVLVAVASINLELEILEQRFASEFAFDVYRGDESVRDNSTFRVQALLNAPAFAITGVWWAAIGTNIAIVVVFFVGLSMRSRAAALPMLAPAVLNFSLFSLRDHVIGVSLFFVAIALSAPNSGLLSRAKNRFAAGGIAVLSLAIARPESMPIVVAASARSLLSRVRQPALRVLALVPLLAAGTLVLMIAPLAVGLPAATTPGGAVEVFQSFFEGRVERSTTFAGDGSNILGGRLSGLPFLVRYPLQVLAFFVAPFPFEIRSVALLVAFADSIFFIWLTRRWLPTAPGQIRALFFTYVLATSLFIDNWGNLYRLRMPVYFILAAAALTSVSREGHERG